MKIPNRNYIKINIMIIESVSKFTLNIILNNIIYVN